MKVRSSDVAVSPATFHTKQGDFGLVIRAVSFFETEYFAVDAAKGTVGKLPICPCPPTSRA